MNEKQSTLKNYIKEELLAKINTHESSIEANTQRIDELENIVHTLNNTIEANSKASDLVVKGIPMLSKENTIFIYKLKHFRLGKNGPNQNVTLQSC
jgi:hypothetical protein